MMEPEDSASSTWGDVMPLRVRVTLMAVTACAREGTHERVSKCAMLGDQEMDVRKAANGEDQRAPNDPGVLGSSAEGTS